MQKLKFVQIFLGESNAAENTKIVIRNHEGNTVATGTFKKCDDENFAYKAVLDITTPVLWNPEQPYLYRCFSFPRMR